MTIREVSTQIINLTSGNLNGEHFSRTRLENQIKAWLRDAEHNTIPYSAVFEGSFGDGEWLFTVSRIEFKDEVFYDYWIPDTREQETELASRIGLRITR